MRLGVDTTTSDCALGTGSGPALCSAGSSVLLLLVGLWPEVWSEGDAENMLYNQNPSGQGGVEEGNREEGDGRTPGHAGRVVARGIVLGPPVCVS